jgi:hypothetical protein
MTRSIPSIRKNRKNGASASVTRRKRRKFPDAGYNDK